jgi:hypothetical protein
MAFKSKHMPLQNLHHIRFAIKSLVLIFLLSVDFAATNAQDMIIGHNQAHLEDLKSVPLEWIDSAKAKLKVAYFHTSHGSQINSGLTPLDAFMGGKASISEARKVVRGSCILMIITVPVAQRSPAANERYPSSLCL